MVKKNRKPEEGENPPAWSYIRPSAGLSRGSKQGLSITAVIAIVLFVIIFVTGAPPESARAIFADFLLAAGLSVLGVWGVGGMIEISGTLRDLTIKAGGGIAILVLVMFVFRPFYSAAVDTTFDEEFEVSQYGSIGILLSVYEKQFFADDKDAIQIVIPNEIRDRIMRFKAEPVGQVGRYKANWDLLRRHNPRINILEKISARQSCVSFVKKEKGQIVANLNGQLKETKVPDEDRSIFTCAQD